LGCPDEVREATDDYKADMDVLADFLAECCEIGPGCRATIGAVFSKYEEWCKGRVVSPLGKHGFNDMISVRTGIVSGKSNGARIWKGLGLQSIETDY